MNLPAKLKIGVRNTRIALALAEEVREALKSAHPSVEIDVVKFSGGGDHVHDGPAAAGGFTRDLDQALVAGQIDAALHDLSDLPPARPDAFAFAAVPKRRHPFDVLLSLDGRILDELEEGERVAASTAVRRAQLMVYRDDLRVVDARGSLETHRRQLEDGQFAALAMAASDAERLGWHDLVTEIFTTEVSVPAPGQGALAIETLASRKDVMAVFRLLDDSDTHGAVIAERAWLRELGGPEDLPAGALAHVADRNLVMEAVVVSPDGLEVVRDEIEGPAQGAETLGLKLAVRMLERGAQEIVETVTGDQG
jgi:hydroxymethylbilane synthase